MWNNGLQATPADTLRAYLSLGAPVVATAPQKSKAMHSFRPPLYIAEPQKSDSLGKVTIEYSLVKDPSNPDESYILCGKCSSQRLFSSLSSLVQHRKRKCRSNTEDDVTDLDSLFKDAEVFLASLSLEDLQSHVLTVDPAILIQGKSKDQLVQMYLDLIRDDKQGPADVPPIPLESDDTPSGVILCERAQRILEILPSLPPHLLAVAVLADSVPVKRTSNSVGTQTDTSKRQRCLDDESSDSDPECSPARLLSPPPPGIRRSSRLSSLYRNTN